MAEAKHGSYYYPQAALWMKVRLEGFGDKSDVFNKWYDVKCLARRVTVNLNEYSKADTFEAEIDYRNFPFDPRSIRALAVTVAMADMGKVFTDTNSLNPISFENRDNVVFMGFADEESISFNDDSRTVRIEGRDYTSLLLDRKFLEGNIDVSKRLDLVIAEMLDALEETKVTGNGTGMRVVTRVSRELPVLASFYSSKGELAGKKNVKKDQSYWDVIQEMVSDAGLIAYVELDQLIITSPQTLYDKSQAKKFIYGRNLKDLEFKRKIGRKKGFNIAVRCLVIESKEVITALIPKEATDAWSKETGIPNIEVVIPKMVPAKASAPEQASGQNQLPDQEAEKLGDPAPYVAFSLKNIANKEQLIEVGQSIYEEMSRQQIEGSLSTREMAIKSDSTSVFSLLKLRIGMPLKILIGTDDEQFLRRFKEKSEIVSSLTDKKFNTKIASALSESLARKDEFFYTKSITFTMDAEQGFDCKIDFLNFINITSPNVER